MCFAFKIFLSRNGYGYVYFTYYAHTQTDVCICAEAGGWKVKTMSAAGQPQREPILTLQGTWNPERQTLAGQPRRAYSNLCFASLLLGFCFALLCFVSALLDTKIRRLILMILLLTHLYLCGVRAESDNFFHFSTCAFHPSRVPMLENVTPLFNNV